MPKEKVTHEPAREVELRLSPASAPARMMNILAAEGGAEATARFASPHHRAGGHRLGLPPARGCSRAALMKILEAERWLKGTNFRKVAFLQRQQVESDASAPHPGARKVEGHDTWSAKTWLPSKGVTLLLKGDSPHLRPQPTRTESSPTRSKVPPYDTGVGSRASCKLAQERRSQNRRARSAQLPNGYKHSSTFA
jgi:hypothetical protein